eukprot:scaffold294765_cov51-Prasinocladus_malaysianus.AAC.1
MSAAPPKDVVPPRVGSPANRPISAASDMSDDKVIHMDEGKLLALMSQEVLASCGAAAKLVM